MAKAKNDPKGARQTHAAEDEHIEFENVPAGGRPDRSEKLGESFKRNQYIITGLIAALLLGVGGYYAWQSYKVGQQEEAVKEMWYAFHEFKNDSLDNALNGSGTYPGLTQLASDYSGTPAGNLSRYMAGAALLDQGKVDEGAEQLRKFDKNDDIVSVMAFAAEAFAAEEKNDFEQAARLYEKASKTMPNKQYSPEFLYQAGRCYEEAKNIDKARSTYEAVRDKFPQSDRGKTIIKEIERLAE